VTTAAIESGIEKRAGSRREALAWRRLLTPWRAGLTLLGLASAFITLWGLQAGQRSEYYAAIALSMSQNLSNFFFGSFDPAGTVTLDKIPGSYWVPAIFVRLFGFSTWSVNAPNAIATVAAVLIVAVTAKRLFNPAAGLLAGAAVAATPIVAAVARSNQPESFFVLAVALVAWAATKAVQRASLGWLIGAGAFVALAFQMYMLEAWAVWPALAAAYLCTRQPWLKKLWHVAVAGVASLALSLTWIIVVWLVPASSRPYVGGTIGNNPFEMVFGYNGLGRFSATSDSTAYRSFTPPFSGSAGVFRLFNEQVAAQIAWLIPTALVSIVVLWMLKRDRAVTVFLGGWLVTFLAMFSVVAGMHQFYTASLAIPMALLLGLAFARARAARMLWAQLVLLGSAAAGAVLIGLYQPGYLYGFAIAQAVVAVLTGVLLVVLHRRRARQAEPRQAGWRMAGLGVLVGASLLLTPAAWAVDVMNHPSSINPIAGESSGIGAFGGGGGPRGGAGGAGGAPTGTAPGTSQGAAPGGMPGRTGGQDGGGRPTTGAGGLGSVGSSSGDSALIAYLEQNRGSATYLVATFGAQTAASLITATDGGSVLPIGGFSSEDPVPTLEAFQQLVASGELRYVLAASGAGGGGGFGSGGASGTSSSSQIQTWVTSECTLVSDSSLSTTGLYDCAP